MTKSKYRVFSNVKNCKSYNYFSTLPERIKHAIEETISKNLFQCLDPVKSQGNCLRVSDQLMLNLREAGVKPADDCKIIYTKDPHPHFWVLVNGWHIDLTARQFNAEEPCPKIWKHEEALTKNLYTVERGTGLVLFKLVPFKAGVKSINPIKRLANYFINKKKNVLDLITNNESFNGLTTHKEFDKWGHRSWKVSMSALLKRMNY